jgi:hypothetical protein
MKWRVISASVRGSSHQRSGLPNQDAVDYGTAPKGDFPGTVLAVSDGHGGGRHFRSQVGSTLAVHIAVTMLQEYLSKNHDGIQTADGDLSKLSQGIVESWLTAVRSDLSHNPFGDQELITLEETDGPLGRESVVARPELAYGATLLVTAVTDNRIIYMQIGDGDILAVRVDGVTTRPIVTDERLVANQTTSLCQPDAWREFRVVEHEGVDKLPVLVLLSTDGYENSFRSEEDFMQIGQDYLQLLREHGSHALADELPGILSEATQQGSGDDITLGLLHVEIIPGAVAASKHAGEASKPVIRPSVMIRDLSNERMTQEKKIVELESNYAGVRKHVVQLRLLVILVLLAAVAILSRQYWLPLFRGGEVKSTKPAGSKHPVKEPPAGGSAGTGESPEVPRIPGDGPDAPEARPIAGEPVESAGQYVLVLSSGKEFPLVDGKTIAGKEIISGEGHEAYARVKFQDKAFKLTNLSEDLWTVTSPGSSRKWQFKKGDNISLSDGMKIEFRKSISGSISFRNKSS